MKDIIDDGWMVDGGEVFSELCTPKNGGDKERAIFAREDNYFLIF